MDVQYPLYYHRSFNIMNNNLKVLYLCICCLTLNVHSANLCDFNHIALLGDSMTWIGGDSCQNDTGWSYHLRGSGLADRIDVYARSGATWTNSMFTTPNTAYYSELLSPDNVVLNQALRLIESVKTGKSAKPDMIVIYAGANDAWFNHRFTEMFDASGEITVPDLDSADFFFSIPVSLEGSIRYVCEILKSRFPDASLLMVTPTEMTKTDVETVTKVSDIIEKVASDYGADVLRADKVVTIRRDEELRGFLYTKDGVHTNPDGARLLAGYIIEAIRQNLEARR